MKKKMFLIMFFTFFIAILSACIKSQAPWLLVLKYCSLAGSFFILGCYLVSVFHFRLPKYPRLAIFLGCVGWLVFLFFCFLSMDTFVFQTWSWYPGLLRYALYDAYGICYAVFLVFGGCFYLGLSSSK